MAVSRRLARSLLSSFFIANGIELLRNPDDKVKVADPIAQPLAQAVPALPQDTQTLVRINGAVQVGAGILLAVGKFRRLSAVALIATHAPATYAEFRYAQDVGGEAQQGARRKLLADLGLLGGLVFAAVDREGAPSLGWQTKRQARRTSAKLHGAGSNHDGLSAAAGSAAEGLSSAAGVAAEGLSSAAGVAAEGLSSAAGAAADAQRRASGQARKAAAQIQAQTPQLVDSGRHVASGWAQRAQDLALQAQAQTPQLVDSGKHVASGLAHRVQDLAEDWAGQIQPLLPAN